MRIGRSSVCNGRANELDQRVHVSDRLPGPQLNRHSVGDKADESRDLLRRRVRSERAAFLLGVYVLEKRWRERPPRSSLLAFEIRVGADLPAHLHVHADPVRASWTTSRSVASQPFSPELNEPLVISRCELEEEVFLRVEVVKIAPRERPVASSKRTTCSARRSSTARSSQS